MSDKIKTGLTTLNISELFPSVQGETGFTGWPTTFIRLAACNLRCNWCDTTYSFSQGKPQKVHQLLEQINEYGLHHVCITGGEPLLQKGVIPFMTQLCDLGYVTSLETGGSLPITDVDQRVQIVLDIKCPGSGMAEKNLYSNLNQLPAGSEIKFVLLNREDYLFAKAICDRFRLSDKPVDVLLSPVHGRLSPKTLIQWIIDDKLKVRLNLQVHKFIWNPDARGV